MLTEITNEATALADPNAHIDLAANLYFGIGSTIFVTIVLTLVTAQLVEHGSAPGTRPTDERGARAADDAPGRHAGAGGARAALRAAGRSSPCSSRSRC